MTAIVIFYVSLVLLVAMFAMKYLGISFEQHEVISNIVVKNDKHFHDIFHHGKNVFSKIRFENFHRLTLIVINFVKKEIIYLKRRFDSKQPAFFLSPQRPTHISKNSVSFFLRKVSEYKDNQEGKNL